MLMCLIIFKVLRLCQVLSFVFDAADVDIIEAGFVFVLFVCFFLVLI